MKQRKQFLNKLGCFSPHLSQHLLRLLLLLVTAIGGVGSSWAADISDPLTIGPVSYENKKYSVTNGEYLNGTWSGGTVTDNGVTEIAGSQYSYFIKLESSTSLSFTTTKRFDVEFRFIGTKLKINGTATSDAVDNVLKVTLDAGTYTITRNSGTTNLYAIIFSDADDSNKSSECEMLTATAGTSSSVKDTYTGVKTGETEWTITIPYGVEGEAGTGDNVGKQYFHIGYTYSTGATISGTTKKSLGANPEEYNSQDFTVTAEDGTTNKTWKVKLVRGPKPAIGNTDCTDAWNSNVTSDAVALETGKTVTFSFTNHNNGGSIWNNWNILAGSQDKVDQTVLRSDAYYWHGTSSNGHANKSGNWPADGDFQSKMNGAQIEVKITRYDNNVVNYYVVMTLTDGTVITEDYSHYYDTAPTYAWLRVDNSYITDLEVTTSDITYRAITTSKNDNDGGTVAAKVKDTNTDAGTRVINGTTVVFTATPAEWYQFDGWYVGQNKVGSETTYTTSVAADLNIQANFTRYYKIQTSATNGTVSLKIKDTDTDVTTDTQLKKGTSITAVATPADGYRFVKWQLDGTDKGIDATLTANKIEDFVGADTKATATLTAIFEEDVTTVSVTSVLVAGKEYVGTLNENKFTAESYYGNPTIVVTLSDGTQPEVTKPNGSSSMSNKTATFSVGGVEYTISYRQQNVSTKDLTAVSAADATTWNFSQLTRPAYIIGDWTWNNMTIFASEEKPIKVGGSSSSFVGDLPVGAQRQQSFAITTSGPGTLTINAEASGSRNVKIVDYNGNEIGNITIGHNGSTGSDYSWEYNGSSMPIYFYVSDNPVARINSITWTPKKPVTSITIPEAVTVHVGELYRFAPTINVEEGTDLTDSTPYSIAWTATSGSGNITLENKSRTGGKVTGAKSNTSDNATAKVKLTIAGVESNECTVTIVRTTLSVRADHVALSHNGNASRKVRAVAYNPYTRKKVGSESSSDGELKISKISITAAPKSGTSAFASFVDGSITPSGTEVGTETWVVTVSPSESSDQNLYAAGTAEIQVTCRDYIYAYDTSKPSTTPTARPVTNASSEIALNYYAGHNPANCLDKNTKEVLKTWGSSNRAPQEQDISANTTTPFARISGWAGIKNVAEPTMNSLTEQHTATTVLDGNSNGTFKYNSYNYSGTHDEFNVPVMGSFYRFYPEKNGTLVTYLCVNGQFSDSEMEKLAKNNATKTSYANRKTYFLDPYANSMNIQNPTIQPTATIQPGFFNYTLENCTGLENFKSDVVSLLNNWKMWGNDEKNALGELLIPVKSASYAEGKTTYTIEDVDWVSFKNLGEDEVGIFHQPIPLNDGSFRVITKAYVRCEIPVEKGRVYYVSPTGTKTRMAGVEFIADSNDPTPENVKYYSGTMQGTPSDTEPYVVPAGQNNFINDGNNGKYFNVTLEDRTFKAGQWYSFCLPFDVTQQQINEIFGDEAVTIHFDHVSQEGQVLTMNFWSHFYNQIRAGRPIMIRMPNEFSAEKAASQKTISADNKTLTKVIFNNVKLNAVDPATLNMTDGEWIFKGTYSPVTMGKNAVIVNGTKFYHYKTTEKTLAGNRAWIQGPENADVQVKTSITLFNDDNNDIATGIESVLSEMGYNVVKSNDKIYNLNGQMVGQGADINNLPKGVYIVNGKKQIVK